MKLAIFITLVTVLQATAGGFAQTITLNANNMSLVQAMRSVQKQSGHPFFLTGKDLANLKVNASIQNLSLDEAMDELLRGKSVDWVLKNETIIVKYAEVQKTKITESPLPQNLIQERTVNGRVVDGAGNPLQGVTVSVKGTSTATITNEQGNYTLAIPNGRNILVFTIVGFNSEERALGNQSILNITLVESMSDLDEVVVIGYGTAKKGDLTGSVARLNAEDFQNQPMTQLSEMLTGTVAGFSSNQSASASGGGSLEIRGPTSLSASTSPMIVLDGVIYNGALSDINPNDVESIDILKDASSAAVYGARAAAGVILVTTKKGKSGKPVVNFSTEIGTSGVTKDRRPFNAEEFLQFREDLLKEPNINNSAVPEHLYTNPFNLPENISIEEWKNYTNNPNSDPYKEYLQRLKLYPTEEENALVGKTVDWYPKVIVNGLRQSYDLDIGGSVSDINYYWSVGYLNNEGVIKGDKFGIIRSRLNFDFNVNSWLNIGAYTQFSERDQSVVLGNLTNMYNSSPFGDEYNLDGSIKLRPHDHPSTYHPLMDYYGQDREYKINSFFSSVFANVKLPFGINYKISFQPRYTYTHERNFWGEHTITGTQTYPGGRGTRSNSKTTEWMLDNLLTWNKEVGVHTFDVTFLYGSEEYKSWSENQANQNFSPNLNLGFHGLQFGDNPSLGNNDTKERGDALMGRLNYTFLNKYLLTASLRRDGYSAFGQEQPRAFFPALALAWKLSDEAFFPKQSIVSQLKLRTSWGVNGNRAIGAYSALAQLGPVLHYDGSNSVVGVRNTSLANPSLVWERTTAFNVGLDLGLLANRIDITADYYVGYTNDLLMRRQLPIMTGFTSVTTNLGKLENRGFEISLKSYNLKTSALKWNTDFVFSFNRNKIISLFGDMGAYKLMGKDYSGEVPDFSNNWFPGHAIDVVWNYDVIGVWQMEELDEATKYNMKPGDFKAVDLNEDYKYEDVMDKQFIGHTKPRYHFGLRNSLSYKDFSASIFLRAQIGHVLPFDYALQAANSEYDRRNYLAAPMPYWTPENRNNEYARLRPIHSAFGGGLKIYKPASFVRVQDVSLSYRLPIANILHLNSLRVFGAIRNLYSFDKWPGWDPESTMTPMPRTFSLGVDISL